MKKSFIYLILLFSLIQGVVQAQWSVGARGAYVRAWEEYGDAEIPANAKIHVNRVQLSALTYYAISQHLRLGLEPGFTQRGAACYPGFVQFLQDTKMLLNYAELPVVIAARYPMGQGKWSVSGKAGFGASRILDGYLIVMPDGPNGDVERRKLAFDDSSNLRRWDYGFYGGVNFLHDLGPGDLFFGTDFYLGLKDVDALNTSKNRSWQFGFGYLHRL